MSDGVVEAITRIGTRRVAASSPFVLATKPRAGLAETAVRGLEIELIGDWHYSQYHAGRTSNSQPLMLATDRELQGQVGRREMWTWQLALSAQAHQPNTHKRPLEPSDLLSLIITRVWSILDNLRIRGTPSSSSPDPLHLGYTHLGYNQEQGWAWVRSTKASPCCLAAHPNGSRSHLQRASV